MRRLRALWSSTCLHCIRLCANCWSVSPLASSTNVAGPDTPITLEATEAKFDVGALERLLRTIGHLSSLADQPRSVANQFLNLTLWTVRVEAASQVSHGEATRRAIHNHAVGLVAWHRVHV